MHLSLRNVFLHKIASTDPTRPEQCAIHYEPPTEKDGPATMTATNGHGLVSITLADQPFVEGATPCLLPADAVKSATAYANHIPTLVEVQQGAGLNRVLLSRGAKKNQPAVEFPLVEGNYPPWRQCVPVIGANPHRIAFNPWLLVRMAEAMGIPKETGVLLTWNPQASRRDGAPDRAITIEPTEEAWRMPHPAMGFFMSHHPGEEPLPAEKPCDARETGVCSCNEEDEPCAAS